MNNQLDRDEDIVNSITTDSKSAIELGKQYGISRERVYQIYSNVSGIKRGSLRDIRKEKKLDRVKFVCAGCQGFVTVREGRYLHKYCRACHEISQKEHRILSLTFKCGSCNKEYHPLAISVRKSKNAFCSQECYLKDRKPNGKKVGA